MKSVRTVKRSLKQSRRRNSSSKTIRGLSQYLTPATNKSSFAKKGNSKTSNINNRKLNRTPEKKLDSLTIQDFNIKEAELLKKTKFYRITRVFCKALNKNFIAKVYQKSVVDSNLLYKNLKEMVNKDIKLLQTGDFFNSPKVKANVLLPLLCFKEWNMIVLIFNDFQEIIDWKNEDSNKEAKIQNLKFILESLIIAGDLNLFIGDVANLELVKFKNNSLQIFDLNNISEIGNKVLCKDQIKDDDFLPLEIERRSFAEENSISWCFGILALKVLTNHSEILGEYNKKKFETLLQNACISAELKKTILELIMQFDVSRKPLKQAHKVFQNCVLQNFSRVSKLKLKKEEESLFIGSPCFSCSPRKINVGKNTITLKTMKMNYLKRQRKGSASTRRKESEDGNTITDTASFRNNRMLGNGFRNRSSRVKNKVKEVKTNMVKRDDCGFLSKLINFLGCN